MTGTAPVALHRIGDIADATGFTVRTLRYYEEIGLIEPAARNNAGHRLYGDDSLGQLYRIARLRDVGLPLASIQQSLEAQPDDVTTLMRAHLTTLTERLTAETRLVNRLASMLATADAKPTSPDLLNLLEDMTMLNDNLERHISILVYDDIEAAANELTSTFGFGPSELTRDPDGNVVHGEIHAGDREFWLHPEAPEFKLGSPRNLDGATATMAVMVADVDAHHARAVEQGAEIRYAPMDQPYGYREYSAVDGQGHLWSFMRPLDN